MIDVLRLLAAMDELQLLGPLLRFKSVLDRVLEHELDAPSTSFGELVGRRLVLDVGRVDVVHGGPVLTP